MTDTERCPASRHLDGRHWWLCTGDRSGAYCLWCGTGRVTASASPRLVRATAPVDGSAFAPNLVTVPNVEVVEVGEDWETSTGIFSWDEDDLVSAIESQQDPAVRTPILKLGHLDPRKGFDGQPSLGRLENLRLTNNDQTLVADLVGVPQWLASIMWAAYPRRSFEGECNVTTRTGNTWPLVITALSLLGDAYPAINTLEDLQTMWGAVAPPLYPAGSEATEIYATTGGKIQARKVIDMKWRLGGGSGADGATPTSLPVVVGGGGGSGVTVTIDGAAIARATMQAGTTVQAGATSFGDLPLADRERSWSKATADQHVRDWASSDGSGDTDKIDWTKYRKAFFWYDNDNPEQLGSYKLMFADVIDGTLTAIPRGVFAAAAVLQGSRGGVDIPSDDEQSVKNLVARYYTKMSKQFDDDTIVPPWEVNSSMAKKKSQNGSVRASASLDDVRAAFYDSLNPAQMWWWIRQVLINPLQLVVDDDEGGLWMVDVTVNADDSFTFGDPVSIKVEYVAAAKEGGSVARPEQLVAAAFDSATDAGARSRATLPTNTPSEEDHNEMKLTPEALAALGLSADASEADISAAIIARGQQTPAGDGATVPTGSAPVEPEPEPEPTPEPEPEPTTPQLQIPEGMELLDAATAQEMRELVAAGRAERDQRAAEERDRLFAEAVQAGKFPRSRIEHYTLMFSADPAGTRELISKMAPGAVPVIERGIAGETDPQVSDASYPKAWQSTVAATSRRAGVGTRVKVGND